MHPDDDTSVQNKDPAVPQYTIVEVMAFYGISKTCDLIEKDKHLKEQVMDIFKIQV